MKARLVKVASVVCALTAIVMFATWTYAAWHVWSNEINVEIEDYELVISGPTKGPVNQTVTITGTLSLDGEAVIGETVTLYVNGISTDTTTTDSLGFQFSWVPSVAGNYTIQAYASGG